MTKPIKAEAAISFNPPPRKREAAAEARLKATVERAAQHAGRHIVELSDLAQVHFARRNPHQKGALLFLPPERSEDRSRRRKKLPLKSEFFGGLPHDLFEAVSGNAINVQRAAEPQHEADGVARSDD